MKLVPLGEQFSHTSSGPYEETCLGHFFLHTPKSISHLAFNLCASHLQLQDGTILLFLEFSVRKQKEKWASPSRQILQSCRGQKEAIRGWSYIEGSSFPLPGTLPVSFLMHCHAFMTLLVTPHSFLQGSLLWPSEQLGLSLQHHWASSSPVLPCSGASHVRNYSRKGCYFAKRLVHLWSCINNRTMSVTWATLC